MAELHDNGVRLRFVGELQSLDPALQGAIKAAETRTRDNRRMTLVLAVAYGGHWDIVQAAQRLAKNVAEGTLDPNDIDEERFAASLMMAEFPGVDLLIRTGGEQRLSNFLLWSLAYSELYFSDVLWPDFSTAELELAFECYLHRQRRFGRTGDQVGAVSC